MIFSHNSLNCGIVILLTLVQFILYLCWNNIITPLTMAITIHKNKYFEYSAAKPAGKPLPRDKTFGIEPDIRFYSIEDGDETGKGEEEEILVVYDSSLTASEKIFVKRKFPYINTFDHD